MALYGSRLSLFRHLLENASRFIFVFHKSHPPDFFKVVQDNERQILFIFLCLPSILWVSFFLLSPLFYQAIMLHPPFDLARCRVEFSLFSRIWLLHDIPNEFRWCCSISAIYPEHQYLKILNTLGNRVGCSLLSIVHLKSPWKSAPLVLKSESAD